MRELLIENKFMVTLYEVLFVIIYILPWNVTINIQIIDCLKVFTLLKRY